MKNPEVSAVLSDVGGVLIRNYDHVARDVQERVELDDLKFGRVWPGLIYRYSTGAISEDAVWQTLENLGGKRVAFTEDLFGQPFSENLHVYHDVLRTMEELGHRGYQLAVLSDTIEPHTEVLKNAGVYDPFSKERIFLSHETKFRKPEIVAYEYAFSQLPVQSPANVLFIDDKESNLVPAQRMGMQTLLAGKTEAEIVASLQFLLED